jgi:hypothetical protein
MASDTHNVYFQNSPTSDFQGSRVRFIFYFPVQQVIVASDFFPPHPKKNQQQHLTKLSNTKVTFQSPENNGIQFKYAERYTSNPHHCH